MGALRRWRALSHSPNVSIEVPLSPDFEGILCLTVTAVS